MDEITGLIIPDLSNGGPLVAVEIRPAAKRVLDVWTAEQAVTSGHESAHVCISAVLNIPVVSASIEDRHGGRTTLGWNFDTELSLETAHRLKDRMAVSWAGLAGEEALFSASTTGCSQDVIDATTIAWTLYRSALDPAFPLIAVDALPHGFAPEALRADITAAIQVILIEQKERAAALVAEHLESIKTFSRLLFSARHLERTGLDEALAEAGLPVRPRV